MIAFSFLVLLAMLVALASSFSPSSIHHSRNSVRLYMADTATPIATTSDSSRNADAEQTYVKCARCQTAYAVSKQDLGANGKGRRLECSVCQHSWFQSKDRLMTLREGFEMVKLPDLDRQRIELNLKEGKNPRFMGDTKLYVGNISFECNEQVLVDLFSESGIVSDVSLVRDELGRIRGFGFITMRTKEGGDKAMEELDGKEVMGRTIAVRESNNN